MKIIPLLFLLFSLNSISAVAQDIFDQNNRFHSMLKNMLPYLVAINLDGMDLSKGQILPIGRGKSEKEMIQLIRESGYKGRIGVLGHRDDEDVEVVLRGNLEGLREILK